jgi:hypothetical protein
MAKSTRKRQRRKQPGSPIGRKGSRKADPKYRRNMRQRWSAADVRTVRELARENTPTRVIGMKLGRTEIAIRGLAQRKGISLRPTNRSPYGRRAKGASRRKARR